MSNVDFCVFIEKTSFGLIRWQHLMRGMHFVLAAPPQAKVTLETWAGVLLLHAEATVALGPDTFWELGKPDPIIMPHGTLTINGGLMFKSADYPGIAMRYPEAILRVNDLQVATFSNVHTLSHGWIIGTEDDSRRSVGFLTFRATWLESRRLWDQ